MTARRRLNLNAVRGTGGRWTYGLRVVDDTDGSVSFTCSGPDGATVEVTGASRYRTTTLAHKMGDPRDGYETEARRAIRELETTS